LPEAWETAEEDGEGAGEQAEADSGRGCDDCQQAR
jgi:hypothetical protein